MIASRQKQSLAAQVPYLVGRALRASREESIQFCMILLFGRKPTNG
jgi:hypothetical protein